MEQVTALPVVVPELAVVHEDLGSDAASVVRTLVDRLHGADRISDAEALVEAVLARDALASTALPGGLAMPHARSAAVTVPSIAVATLPEAITWTDGTSQVGLVLLIAAPGDDPIGYLDLLQKVATACVKKAFVDDLPAAATPEQLAGVLGSAIHQR